jgi:ribonuclease HII
VVVAEAQVPLGLVRDRWVVGIDEAGRGAVLGPLVVAGVWAPEARLSQLSQLGAQDSKRVPRGKRKGILLELTRAAKIRVVVIPARTVDRVNLTELELQAAGRLVRRLVPDLNSPGTVVVDTPVPRAAIPKFGADLAREAGLPAEAIRIYPRADASHPAVATASLAAKVVRDAYVVFLRREYGDFGWGYPGEERVREFLGRWLADHGEFPDICRTRWRAAQRLLSKPFPGFRPRCD